MMFKAYIDDSHMAQPPVYVLAGWIARVDVWARFSDAWRDVLWMRPRFDYFKYSEAMNFNGQFNGFSGDARNEKLRLLLRVIEENGLLGISSIIPSETYDIVRPYVKNPYIHSFFGIIVGLLRSAEARGISGKIDFVFDYQPGSRQTTRVEEGWEVFKQIVPPDVRKKYLHEHPPTFQSDKDVVALQAADFHAGWLQEQTARQLFELEPPQPIWGTIGDNIERIYWIMRACQR